jgi:DNA-binding transcriptional LysR family regulator
MRPARMSSSTMKSAGRLVPVLTELEVTAEAIHAVYPATRHVSSKVRSFIEHLLAGLGGPGSTAPSGPSAPAGTGQDADDR